MLLAQMLLLQCIQLLLQGNRTMLLNWACNAVFWFLDPKAYSHWFSCAIGLNLLTRSSDNIANTKNNNNNAQKRVTHSKISIER